MVRFAASFGIAVECSKSGNLGPRRRAIVSVSGDADLLPEGFRPQGRRAPDPGPELSQPARRAVEGTRLRRHPGRPAAEAGARVWLLLRRRSGGRVRLRDAAALSRSPYLPDRR